MVCHPQGVVAPARALTPATLGAWLLKATGSAPSTRAHVRAGFAGVDTWCVQPTYRTDLVEAGEAGVVPVALSPVAHPLLRTELTGHPDLAGMEVLRVPAGSNPSFVTPEQLRVLVELCPELSPSA